MSFANLPASTSARTTLGIASHWSATWTRWRRTFPPTRASCCAHAQTPSTRPPQKYETLGRQILSELISIDTTIEKGSTVAAKAVAARAIANGFPQADVTVVTPRERPDSASVVVRLRGRTRERPVLYIAHPDVVHARRAG